MAKKYTVSDGKLDARGGREGGYVVTSPLEPELITEADSITEAFENARDAVKMLRDSRAKLLRRARRPGRSSATRQSRSAK